MGRGEEGRSGRRGVVVVGGVLLWCKCRSVSAQCCAWSWSCWKLLVRRWRFRGCGPFRGRGRVCGSVSGRGFCRGGRGCGRVRRRSRRGCASGR